MPPDCVFRSRRSSGRVACRNSSCRNSYRRRPCLLAAWLLALGLAFPTILAAETTPEASGRLSSDAAAQAERPGYWSAMALDAALPGSGAWRAGDRWRAGAIFGLRAGSAYAAAVYWRQSRDYRAAERFARTADAWTFFRGGAPGLRYPDPYSRAFRSADDFGREADRLASNASLAVFLHGITLAWSLFDTHNWLAGDDATQGGDEAGRAESGFFFEAGPGQGDGSDAGRAFAFEAQPADFVLTARFMIRL